MTSCTNTTVSGGKIPVVGRFAPTPSWRMHLGNLFAAVLAWASVRAQDGTFVLRIEDLDTFRSFDAYAEALKDDLRWLGLDWDQEQTPQSRRTAAYDEALERLRAQGLVYPCWCTRGVLNAASAPHANDGHRVYPGFCRELTDEQRSQRAAQAPPSLRLRVPDEVVSFTDGLQGKYSEQLREACGDFVIRKADGGYAYQLAVVVDDIAAGVTEVVRGRDLLSSTPRQLYLYRLLDAVPPAYFHLPLLLGPGGRRLSKRDRDLDVGVLRERCSAPELLGHLAHLAGLQEQPQPLSVSDLPALFDWARIGSADREADPENW